VKHFSWIITIPILIVTALFAVTNREMVSLTVWPWVISLPTWLLILGCMLIGFLFGTVVAWFSGGERRRRARRLRERVQVQARQLTELRSELAAALARSTAAAGSRAAGVASSAAAALPFRGGAVVEPARRSASD
jgi:uncharacterized integral membrane protein